MSLFLGHMDTDEMDYVMENESPVSSQPHEQPQYQQQQQHNLTASNSQSQSRPCPDWRPDGPQSQQPQLLQNPSSHAPDQLIAQGSSQLTSQLSSTSSQPGLATSDRRRSHNTPFDPVHSVHNSWYQVSLSNGPGPLSRPDPYLSVPGPVSTRTVSGSSAPIQSTVALNQQPPSSHDLFAPLSLARLGSRPAFRYDLPALQSSYSLQHRGSDSEASNPAPGITLPSMQAHPPSNQAREAIPGIRDIGTSPFWAQSEPSGSEPTSGSTGFGSSSSFLAQSTLPPARAFGLSTDNTHATLQNQSLESLASRSPMPPFRLPPIESRRSPIAPTRQTPRVDYPSSEDDDTGDESDQATDEEHQALRLIEHLATNGNNTFRPDITGDRIRTQQLLRGQISTKRIASKNAVRSLEPVEIIDLPAHERSCIICYNEFGVVNAEGITESPLRLPKCSHIFGSYCIRKWFEESDSCPYCRDRLESMSQLRASPSVLREIFRTSFVTAFPGSNNRNALPLRGEPMDTYARLFGTRDELERSPTRTMPATPAERRSPSSEVAEHRRRRPRYSNFRGSPSSNGSTTPRSSSFGGPSGATSSLHGQARDRFSGGNHRPNITRNATLRATNSLYSPSESNQSSLALGHPPPQPYVPSLRDMTPLDQRFPSRLFSGNASQDSMLATQLPPVRSSNGHAYSNPLDRESGDHGW